MGPVKAIEMRGCALKPSSVLRTSTSAQALGRVAQSRFGRFSRIPVRWLGSSTVKMSLGNGVPETSTLAAPAAAGTTIRRARTRGSRRRNDGMGVSSGATCTARGTEIEKCQGIARAAARCQRGGTDAGRRAGG